jgi:hypothetical protein
MTTENVAVVEIVASLVNVPVKIKSYVAIFAVSIVDTVRPGVLESKVNTEASIVDKSLFVRVYVTPVQVPELTVNPVNGV